VLSNHTDTVDRSLSNCRVLGVSIPNNLVADLWVEWSKEVWSKELNHIIKDEKQNLLLMLGSIGNSCWQNSGV
jgi:hypothetical protein